MALEILRDPRLEDVEWRDLCDLGKLEVAYEVAIYVPWLVASCVFAHFAFASHLAWLVPALILVLISLGAAGFAVRPRLLRRSVWIGAAVAAGGSTIRDYRRPGGDEGEFQRAHQVFGHLGEPCPRCGDRIRKIRVVGRGTHYCARCQPRRKRSVRRRPGSVRMTR